MKQAAAMKTGRAQQGKQDQIREAAARLFVAQGYAATSMDAVAAEAGVSKATLYAHFKSKRQLFEAIVQTRFEEGMEPNLTPAQLGDDPLEGLAAVGRHFLTLLTTPPAMATFRLVLAESQRLPELGEAFYNSGPKRTLAMVAAYIEYLAKRGAIAASRPEQGADMLLGMLRGKAYLKCLLGLAPQPGASEIDRLAREAASFFLAACSPRNLNP